MSKVTSFEIQFKREHSSAQRYLEAAMNRDAVEWLGLNDGLSHADKA